MIKSMSVTNYLGESIEIPLGNPYETGFAITEIEGLGSGKSDISVTELTSRDGSIFNSSRVGTRNIVLTIRFIETPDIETVRQKTYKYFPIKKQVTLGFETDNRSCYINGYVESNEPDIFSDKESSQISIICPDPYFYSKDLNSTVFSGVISEFEFPFSNELPIDPVVFGKTTQNGTGDPSPTNVRPIEGIGENDCKIVFDGTESWAYESGEFRLTNSKYHWVRGSGFCTHYKNSESGDKTFFISGEGLQINFRDPSFSSASEWKQYLANQFSEGTPVTVCYKQTKLFRDGKFDKQLILNGENEGINWVVRTSASYPNLFTMDVPISDMASGATDLCDCNWLNYVYPDFSNGEGFRSFSGNGQVGTGGVLLTFSTDRIPEKTLEATLAYLKEHPLVVWYQSGDYKTKYSNYKKSYKYYVEVPVLNSDRLLSQPIELAQPLFDGDVLDGLSRSEFKSKLLLDGREQWIEYYSGEGAWTGFACTILDKNYTRAEGATNQYIVVSNSQDYVKHQYHPRIWIGAVNNRIYAVHVPFKTVEEWTSYLKENPLEIWYDADSNWLTNRSIAREIHQKGLLYLDGSEDYIRYNSTYSTIIVPGILTVGPVDAVDQYDHVYSSHFPTKRSVSGSPTIFSQPKYGYVVMYANFIKNIEQARAFFAEQNANGTPVTIVYEPRYPQIYYKESVPWLSKPFEENQIEYSSLELSTEKNVYYSGDSEVGVTIKIQSIGTVEHLTIYNTKTREFLKIDTDKLESITGHPIIEGDELMICTVKGKKSITLLRDGETINILNTMTRDSSWLQLTKGDNLFAYSAETGSEMLYFTIESNILYEGI